MIKPHSTDRREQALPTTIRDPKHEASFFGWGPRVRY